MSVSLDYLIIVGECGSYQSCRRYAVVYVQVQARQKTVMGQKNSNRKQSSVMNNNKEMNGLEDLDMNLKRNQKEQTVEHSSIQACDDHMQVPELMSSLDSA